MRIVAGLLLGVLFAAPSLAQQTTPADVADAAGTAGAAIGDATGDVTGDATSDVTGTPAATGAARESAAGVGLREAESSLAVATAAIAPAVDTSATQGPARAVVIDRLDLGTTSITGNQELPKVLYIVPWKRSDLGDLIGRPANTLLDEVLAPVDREVFERHLSYYETLHGESQEE